MATAGVARAQLVINEVDYDQQGPDEGEFIELFNAGGSSIAMGGFTIELVEGSDAGAVVYRTVELPDATLVPGDYYCVCVTSEATPNCDVSVPKGAELLFNGPLGAIGLRDASGAMLDALSYEGTVEAPYAEGTGITAGNPNLVFASIGRFPDGADTQDNSVDFIGACATPGNPNVDLIENCCGDGEINGDEECDDGRMNGRVACGCRSDCTRSPAGEVCAAGVCEVGVCDDNGACVNSEQAEAGTPCGDLENGDCTDIDTCDGAGNCLANDVEDNTACDDDGGQVGCPGLCSAGSCVTQSEADECVPLICGDGLVDGPEECDDGNQVAGDGCDRCLLETGGPGGGGGGCACQSGGAPGGVLGLFLLVAITLRRRRLGARS